MTSPTAERMREIDLAPRDQDGFPVDMVLTEQEHFLLQVMDNMQAERLVPRDVELLTAMDDFWSNLVDDSEEGTSSEINTVLLSVWMASREALEFLRKINEVMDGLAANDLSSAALDLTDDAKTLYDRLVETMASARARADEAFYEEVVSG